MHYVKYMCTFLILKQPPACANSNYSDQVTQICNVGCSECVCENVGKTVETTLCQLVCPRVFYKVSSVCTILVDIISTPLTPTPCGSQIVPPQNFTLCHDTCKCCDVQDPNCEQKCQQASFVWAWINTCETLATVSGLG